MYAPRLTFRSPVLTVPYFSLDGLMEENPKKRIFDQLLSGDKDDQALQKKKPCCGKWAWNPPLAFTQQVEPSDPFFAFELTFVRESSSIESPRVGLAWARSDTAVVKDRLLGRDQYQGPSLDVLTEFFADALEIQARGTVVAHDLRWKSAVLEAQFSRYGLEHLAARWRTLTQRSGLCLMSPEVGLCLGVPNADCPTSMGDLCHKAGVQYPQAVTTRDGAVLCLSLMKRLRQHAIPPCARGLAPHEFCAWDDCTIRDNGELFSATCRLCGHSS